MTVRGGGKSLRRERCLKGKTKLSQQQNEVICCGQSRQYQDAGYPVGSEAAAEKAELRVRQH